MIDCPKCLTLHKQKHNEINKYVGHIYLYNYII